MPFCCLKLGRRKRGPDGSSGRASKGAGTKATPLLQHEATNGGGASSRVQSGGVKKGQGATDAEDVLSQTGEQRGLRGVAWRGRDNHTDSTRPAPDG